MDRTAVLFDMDGLMVDTEPLSRRAWDAVLQRYGVALDDQLYDRMLGRRLDESARLVQEAFPALSVTAEVLATQKSAVLLGLLAGGAPVRPGLWLLLAEIEARGLPWGVATSSPRRQAEIVLEQLGLDGRCRALVGGDEVANGKPSPDIFLLAARRIGARPEKCLALEDSTAGCRAAASAGMLVLVVPGAEVVSNDYCCARRIYASLADIAGELDHWLVCLSGGDGC